MKEKLVGSIQELDYLATLYGGNFESKHPLQDRMEDIVETFTDLEREVFYLRYGERKSIRVISRELWGYLNIKGVQDLLASIKEKVKSGLETRNT